MACKPVWLVPLLVLVGCEGSLAPLVDHDVLTVEFAVVPSMCTSDLLTRATEWGAVGSEGAIDVTGIYGAPNGGYELSPFIEAPSAGRLKVIIQGEQRSPGITIAICHVYELRIAPVRPGWYEIELIHADRSLRSAARTYRVRVR